MATRKNTYVDFSDFQPVSCTQALGAATSNADNAVNHFMAGNRCVFEMINSAVNSDVTFTRTATGWTIPNDNTGDDGVELGLGILAAGPGAFTVGTDPAFQLSVKFTIPDVSDYDVAAVGFRKQAAYTAAIEAHAELGTDYTDIACLNVNAGDIYTVTRINSATATLTDTTDNWADTNSKTLTVKVSGAGVVTFEIDGAAPTTNTNTLTFDDGDVVIPFVAFTKVATDADTPPTLETFLLGYQ